MNWEDEVDSFIAGEQEMQRRLRPGAPDGLEVMARVLREDIRECCLFLSSCFCFPRFWSSGMQCHVMYEE